MNSEQLKILLSKHNIRPNFTYGQNFLIDDVVLQDIADSAGVTKEDCVLEIGPGVGNLTKLLLERAKLVLSIEKDPKFKPILQGLKKDYKNFRYEIADALSFNFQRFFAEQECGSYKVVANIPYYITGKILQMVFSAKLKPESVTILTQKEVAKNVIAEAGSLSVLAISVQLYGHPQIVKTVPARSFYPAPKVDSAVLHIVPYKKPKYAIKDEKIFFRVVKACFAGKRKQIHNTLANNLGLSKEGAVKVLEDAKISPAARPQELEIEDWIRLIDNIEEERQ